MGGEKNNHVDKGYYPHAGYPPSYGAGAYASYPPIAYPYHYPPQGLGCPPPPRSYPYSSSMCLSHGYSGYPPSGYPHYGQSVHPQINSYPGHGYGNMGMMLTGGAVAAVASSTYGVPNGHHHHGHHLGHFGKFKHYPHHGHYGKYKHGKFGKHMRQ
uniref:Glycine-rich protein A3 n=1 Tax=Arundo donax TaxID=35708 RepID=A0A0A9FS64_ARUDO